MVVCFSSIISTWFSAGVLNGIHGAVMIFQMLLSND